MAGEGDLMLEGEEDKGKDDNKEDKDNDKKGDVKKEGAASQESTKDTADAGQSANNSKRETRTGRLLVRGGLWEVQVIVYWPGSHVSHGLWVAYKLSQSWCPGVRDKEKPQNNFYTVFSSLFFILLS